MYALILAFCGLCALLSCSARAHAQPPDAASAAQPALGVPHAGSQGDAQLSPPAAQRASALRYELYTIDQEIARLRAARPRVFLPCALTLVGAGMASVSTLVALLLWATSVDHGYRWDAEGNRRDYYHVNTEAREQARQQLAFVAVGLGALAGGLVWLVPRLKVRRSLSLQAGALRQRRRVLLQELGPRLSFGVDGARVTARLAF